MKSTARVVIIGGGAVGASCLYHLASAGVTDCVLVEKDELTSGSTWHAAGNVPTYANSWLGMRAGNYAWRLYSELAADPEMPITYRHTGAFWPAHSADRMDLYQYLTGISRSEGLDLALLTTAEMEAMHPYYRAGESVIGGIHDPYEGDIDPSQLTQALAGHARRAGAVVERFNPVERIERTADGQWRVTTAKGAITCEIVVNATGFYGAGVSAMIGRPLPVAVLEHQYLVTEPLPVLEEDSALFPLVRDPELCFYLRRERASLLFGSYAHEGRLAFTDGLPADFAHSLFEDSVDDIGELAERAARHVPMLAEAGVQRFVNGPIGYSPDAVPLCGPAHGLPNFYHACGIQVGITHAAAVGKAITEWITEGETEWDLAAWDPRRFGDWATERYARERIVELYGLQYAIPFPHRLMLGGRPVNQTPLYERLAGKGAVFGQVGGWERAFWFDTKGVNNPEKLSFRDDEPWRDAVRAECEAVRDRVGVMDHGGFAKFEVTGPGSRAYLDRVFCGRIPAPGRLRLGYMLTPRGRIWSEATITCLAPDRFLLCGPTVAVHRDEDWLRQFLPADGSVALAAHSGMDAALMVMGPASRSLIGELCSAEVAAMPWLSAAEIEVAGCEAIALRVSYVGELGWELHLRSRDLEQVYDALCEAGTAHGLVDFGSWALNAMRVEKAYHAAGADIGTEYTLFDCGLAGFADLDKPEFIGRAAMLEQRETEPEWRFVRMRVAAGDAEPLPGEPLLQGGEVVGYVTSSSPGFRIGQCVALGYVRSEVASETKELRVQVLGDERRATLEAQAFYDPRHDRCRA